MVSREEVDRRYRLIREAMAEQQLDAVLAAWPAGRVLSLGVILRALLYAITLWHQPDFLPIAVRPSR